MRVSSLLLLCCHAFVSIYRGTLATEAMNSRTIQPYMGFVDLGMLINLQTDTIGFSILNSDFQQSSLQTEIINSSITHYQFVETNQDASSLLGIEGQASLNFELGVKSSANGYGNYFTNIGNRKSYTELLFQMKIVKKTVSLENLETTLDGNRCKEISDNAKGTHIVTGLQYGSQCIISLRISAETAQQKEAIKGDLSGAISVSGTVAINGSFDGNYLDEVLNTMENVTVFTYCNAEFDFFPTTSTQAINLIQSYPQYVTEQLLDETPIAMELTPINDFPPCEYSAVWNVDSIYQSYIDNAQSMVQDLKNSYSLLWNCMEFVTDDLSSEVERIKKDAKHLRDLMRSTSYELKTKIKELQGQSVAGMDVANLEDEYSNLVKIYSNGENYENPNNYGNQYWYVKATYVCGQIESGIKVLDETTESELHRPCISVQNVLNRNKGSQITNVDDGNPENAVTDSVSQCFEATGTTESSAMWGGRTLYYSRKISSIQIFFGECDLTTLGEIDVYVTSQLVPTGKHPTYRIKIGTISIDVIRNIDADDREISGVQVDVTGNSGYVTVLQLESTGNMCLCNVVASGEYCQAFDEPIF